MNAAEITTVFNQCFLASHRTRMCGAASEPMYVPARQTSPAQLHFRDDYAASALHEAAHWCLAGNRRRQIEDFGYRYIAPPRTRGSREAFFRFERRPQALESFFAHAAGISFRVSVDDFGLDDHDALELARQTELFSLQVHITRLDVYAWLRRPAAVRARKFLSALDSYTRRRMAEPEPAHG